jgi:hypothetical protein
VNDAQSVDHEIAIAFEEDFGWGGLTRLRVVAEYEVLDTDGDNVLDTEDACPMTAAGEVVDATGCSVADLCPCEESWGNRGEYLSCVNQTVQTFLEAKLITAQATAALISAAAQSTCGQK